MNQREEEFLQRLRATFRVEAEEHVQALSSGLIELERAADAAAQQAGLEKIFRHAHSLKGAARAINYPEVETLCQVGEDVFAAGRAEKIRLGPGDFDGLHRAVDLIARLVRATVDAEQASARGQVTAIRQELERMVTREASPRSPGSDRARQSVSPKPPAAPPTVSSTPATSPAVRSDPGGSPARPAALAETVRVATSKLDRLVLQAEEMLTAKQLARQRVTDLREFDALFQRLTRRWASAGRGGEAATTGSWDEGEIALLEERLRRLRKSAARDAHAMGKRVDDLLGDAKRLVMLPFSSVADGFPKLVRDLSRDQGKEAEFVLHGGDIEVDKRVLEEMKDPLVHLLRNSIDHGVEAPAERVGRGKPSRATITMTVSVAEGSRVEIRIADDGGGIDPGAVKAAAVAHGRLTASAAAGLSEDEARQLIFLSEVSTSPAVTEISGRGLGLAIVRERAQALGGSVGVESTKGRGTTFWLVLPLALSTFHGVLVRVADQILVVPTTSVERVARVKRAAVGTVENREVVTLDGRVVAVARLRDVLGIRATNAAAVEEAPDLFVVVIGTGEGRIAFVVDEVLHDEEVLVKGLVPPLSRVRNVTGATVLASGKVTVILNPADLLRSARRLGTPATPGVTSPARVATKAPAKTVLVVEDSITSRMLLKGILELAGYRVKTAIDGIDALTTLRTGEYDLVVSDIEMPRMNGFDLTASIRADRRLAQKPVILVSALGSQADREHGIDVGASAYIVKGSFDQSNLLEAVRRLI